MKNLLKKLLRWALGHRIRIYNYDKVFPNEALIRAKYPPKPEDIRRAILVELVEQLYQNKLIGFDQIEDPRTLTTRFRASIWVVK